MCKYVLLSSLITIGRKFLSGLKMHQVNNSIFVFG